MLPRPIQISNPLKKKIIFFFYLFTYQITLGQELYLNLKTDAKTEIIDSIGYQKKHFNRKSIEDEVAQFKQKLLKNGFLSATNSPIQKINDSTFTSQFNLGVQNKFIHIYIGENFKILDFDSNEQKLAISEIENFMKTALTTLERKGHSLAKIKLTNFRNKNQELFADLKTDIETERRLDDIVINGYEKFPKNYTRHLKRIYKKQIFNQETLKKLSRNFEVIPFAKQTKNPEILFSKDSTKVYLYLEKAKPNTFDGFIGFTNNERKVIFNGYLDLKLQNILNSGEKFNLYWKSDGENQKTFDVNTEIPFIFNSSLGIKAQLNIFKQDSIFQNAKNAIDLGYYFNYNTKLYIGYQSIESSDIQNTNNATISDFNNSFITTHLDYKDFDPTTFLFPEKTIIYFKLGLGKRETNFRSEKQFFANLHLSHNFYLNKKNSINIRSQNYYLKSDNYILNELFRFGGINSIRGFNENSLQANLFTSILSEYRYNFNNSLYLHTITDYGYYQDKTTNTSNQLIGLGFGFGLNTKTGLFNLVYANGSTKQQAIKLSNSIVHLSFKTQF